MIIQKFPNTEGKHISDFLDSYPSGKVLIYFSTDSILNILCLMHILPSLSNKYKSFEFVLGVGSEYSFLSKFGNIIKIDRKNLNLLDYDYMFEIQKNVDKYFDSNNDVEYILEDMALHITGIDSFTISPLDSNAVKDNNSEFVYINSGVELTNSKIRTEMVKSGLRDIFEEDSFDENLPTFNLFYAYPSSTGGGSVIFNKNFKVEAGKVKGVVNFESIELLDCKSQDYDSDEDEYNFSVPVSVPAVINFSLSKNKIEAELDFSSMNISEDLIDLSNSVAETRTLLDVPHFGEELSRLFKCKYYIGREDELLLLAYLVLGKDNCIILSKGGTVKSFSFFENRVDISKPDIMASIVEKLGEMNSI